ncbi:sensor domain-containing phosphodiesterase [Gaiella occulta]|nr:EAL domain-containing protein [Gaiella occulta]
MRRVVDQALLLIPTAEGAVVELERSGILTYVCGAGSLAAHTGTRLRAEASLSGLAIRAGETLRCDDSESDDRVDREACRRVGAISMICVPLRRGTEAVGVLKVVASRPRVFGDGEVSTLRDLAEFVTAAISAASDIAHAAGGLVMDGSDRRDRSAGSDLDVGRASHLTPHGKAGVSEFVANVLQPGIVESLETRQRIEQVLATSAFTIVCQPIVDLRSGELAGVEALARFRGPPEQPPDAWFDEAERVGLGIELELAAVGEALTLLDQLPEQAYLAVNVGHKTVAAPELGTLLDSAGAHRVVLELTEHVEVEDYRRLGDVLAGIRTRGTRLAIDDSGSGYSGLTRIVNLAPDLIKLDRVMTRGIDLDPVRRALAGALVTFASDTGASVIAEGIETEDELSTVETLGIRYGQGYFLGRPSPVTSVPRVFPRAVPSKAVP